MKYPIRRAQLISPFGPGAMSISKNGISSVCSGLDHWFKDRHGKMDSTDLSQYKIKEWRLERLLGVDHFRLPPDFRTRSSGDEDMNMFLTVPFLRFPKWHYCTFCGQMHEFQYYEKRMNCVKVVNRKGIKTTWYKLHSLLYVKEAICKTSLGGSGSINKRPLHAKKQCTW